MLCCECDDLIAVLDEKRLTLYQQCTRSTLNKIGKGRVNLMLGAGAQDKGLQPQQTPRLLDIFGRTLRARTFRIRCASRRPPPLAQA